MKQTKKGNEWHFGMKVHIGTDTQGHAYSAAVTDAGVHDSQMMDELLHGEETSFRARGCELASESQSESEQETELCGPGI